MMYTVQGVKHVVPEDFEERMERDGHCSSDEVEVTESFGTAMGMLRWCINEGAFRNLRGSGDPKTPDRALIERGNPLSFKYRLTDAHIAAMRRAQSRYRDILHYLREIEPEWRPDVERTKRRDGRVHYADNSVVIFEINKYGGRRQREERPPSGDLCF